MYHVLSKDASLCIMVGDGFGIDTLESTISASEKRFHFIASASAIRTGERTEHIILLRKRC